MTYPPDFSDAKAKVEWAKGHRNQLKQWTEGAFTTRPDDGIIIRSKYNSETAAHDFYPVNIPARSFSRRWGLALGDFVHNARSALDQSVWQAALHFNNGRDPNRPELISYPIAYSPDGLNKRSAKHTLANIHPLYRQIIEQFQPYETRNPQGLWWFKNESLIHPLAWIRCLSNRDKHRVITPLMLMTKEFRAIPAFSHTIRQDIRVYTDVLVEKGAKVLSLALTPPEPEAEFETELAPRVTLADRSGVAEMADAMVFVTEQIVGEFEGATRQLFGEVRGLIPLDD